MGDSFVGVFVIQGLKLGRRKGHDPARDIAEWNKLKGMSAGKAGKGTILQHTCRCVYMYSVVYFLCVPQYYIHVHLLIH